MNVDASESVLDSHICFNALATLQNIKNVENSCNFCSSSDHDTYVCPVLSKGEHVKDTSTDNLSWSSVPHGLQIYQDAMGLHIISVQKFAKGCRFGPLMAPKSYIPVENAKFPLKIFGTVNLDMDAMHMSELRDLFNVRHIHLDTRNEKYCNWMIHVDPAQYSNEQNLIAYEEDNEIFFAAIEDLDVGDLLKVWYSPKYGERMKMPLLLESPYPVTKNVLSRGGVALPEIQLFGNYTAYDHDPNHKTEIMLPSIKTIIKPSSYVCYENHAYSATNSYYDGGSSTNNLINSLIDHTNDDGQQYAANNSLLNLDDTFSTETEFNDFMGYEDEGEKLEKLEKLLSTANDNESITSDMQMYPNASGQNGTEKDEKKVYPCRLCDKKYSTMTNIYRHVRAQHSCFLCSLCMNMFSHENELKEHIHKCPKSDDKKPQCVVCMQYFSNSWSLTRHIKIHVSAGECEPDILVEKKVKESKKVKDDSKENFDFSDIEKNSQDGFVVAALGSTPETLSCVESDSCTAIVGNNGIGNSIPIVNDTAANQTLALDKLEIGSPDGASAGEKDNEVSSCIVCEKKFKSKSCMNKHLRSVHAVRILTGVKRSSSNHGHSKNNTKRSYLSESQSSITHTGSPVNPMTAKALASKLNERHNMLNGTKKISTQGMTANNGTVNDIPVPPLISIQTTSSPSNRFKDGDDQNSGQQQRKISQAKKNATTDSYVKSGTDAKHHKIEKSNKQSNGINALHHPKTVANNNNQSPSSPTKMHKCDSCSKKFNKKYELKRHKTVHENITYTCPFCNKMVKRKPSMIKHLRIVHKEEEHIWSDGNFVAQLKKYTKAPTDGFVQSESSNTNESSTDERHNIQSKNLTSDINSMDNDANGEIYKNVFLSGDAKMPQMNCARPAAAISNTSEDEMSLLEASSTVDLNLVDGNRKQSVVNMTTQSSLNNIIDDCFFGDDALNCNVVLVHSPFSSDNDVDGFTMNNDNGECVMNKELLSKFQESLEDMEEKVDSTDFKTIWEHVLDEDNLNDDICTDEIDESVVV
ncbi:uncharacterized protein LOC116348727 [Contarinia nasturtii]|uniref:uncharacterized protein LOC116348727 n=1 Tax=Contarinia nasturtii TaxID=265458 RepID=UPI0012D49031|nr:uncharacterized protein LOC116348727 [Contarinia nasturtii]